MSLPLEEQELRERFVQGLVDQLLRSERGHAALQALESSLDFYYSLDSENQGALVQLLTSFFAAPQTTRDGIRNGLV